MNPIRFLKNTTDDKKKGSNNPYESIHSYSEPANAENSLFASFSGGGKEQNASFLDPEMADLSDIEAKFATRRKSSVDTSSFSDENFSKSDLSEISDSLESEDEHILTRVDIREVEERVDKVKSLPEIKGVKVEGENGEIKEEKAEKRPRRLRKFIKVEKGREKVN